MEPRQTARSALGTTTPRVAKVPELLLGSYTMLGDPEYSVKLTLESKDQVYVEAVLANQSAD